MLPRKLYYGYKAFRTVRYGRERLRRFQRQLLIELVEHTYESVPFYRDLWDRADVAPDAIKTLDDLRKLPVVDAYEFRRHIGDLREAMEADIGGFAESGGSSGQEALETAFDTASFDWVEAVHMRGLMLQGCMPGRTQSQYSHEDFEGGLGRRLIAPKRRIKTTWSPERQLEVLEEYDSPYLVYFPHPLFTLAKKALRSDQTYDIAPDRILTGGEVLTPTMRETIMEAFDAPIYDNYQTNEVIQIAWECPDRGGYHVAADSVIVEVLDDGDPVGQGEPGEVVLTGLTNHATPIIRYNIGDIAIRGEDGCECSTSFPLLNDVIGRVDNVVAARDGSTVYPAQIIDVLARYNDLLRFRFVETEDGAYRVKYVPNTGFDRDTLDAARDRLETELGIAPVTFDAVDDLEKTESGKMKPVVSDRES